MSAQAEFRKHPDDAMFRHEALVYSGDDGFVEATAPFIDGALAADETILVMIPEYKIDLLRSALGGDAAGVHFADMSRVGRNPARIIPAWRDFIAQHGSRRGALRGIGEPIWASRGPAELVECQRHESLLNLAFADAGPFWLLCPYDRAALPASVLDEAYRSHPFIVADSRQWESDSYHREAIATALFDGALPDPHSAALDLRFDHSSLNSVRRLVSQQLTDAGFGAVQTADFVLAVNETATNSIVHGGGGGHLRVWREGDDTLVCEIRDRGRITHPMVGRERPPHNRDGGRGLWMVNELCDLAQVRSDPAGTVVRLHMRRH
ncbi:MAG TPA: anti-sigma factor RsbA family regulatory protein [Egibacteraceae bacterium]|nr:anti-sigma factor RsbA family regulatory protein [Egibacteraceae bacterium]